MHGWSSAINFKFVCVTSFWACENPKLEAPSNRFVCYKLLHAEPPFRSNHPLINWQFLTWDMNYRTVEDHWGEVSPLTRSHIAGQWLRLINKRNKAKNCIWWSTLGDQSESYLCSARSKSGWTPSLMSASSSSEKSWYSSSLNSNLRSSPIWAVLIHSL